MLTPQEVSEHAFSKASFGGYNMTMVDEFLDILTVDYTALYNENAVLKSKMKVLVDKVEEYRSTEEAMRKALLTAQRMADEMIREAEQKKTTILEDARRETADEIARIRQEIADEEYRLTAARNATAVYVDAVRQQHQKELEYLDNLSALTPAPKAEKEDTVDEAAHAIEESLMRMLREENARLERERQQSAAPAAEPQQDPAEDELSNTTEFAVNAVQTSLLDEEEPQDEPEEDKVVHRDFGRLEFGRDYEIK